MKKPKEKLTQERLKELLHYNPETGIFTNKIRRGMRGLKGAVTGADNGNGYICLAIDFVNYRANRLAWLYMEGYWPEHDIDHKNRIKIDNRWENLRHVSRSCNLRNKGVQKNNKSGVTGVCFSIKYGKWSSDITVDRKVHKLGMSVEFSDAVLLRWNAEKKHNFPNCNTTSSAYLYLKENGFTEVL